jgi:hypothetical protein
MCFPGGDLLSNAAQGFTSGMASLADARWQAKVARHEGKQARLAAEHKASQIDQQGTQELAAIRRQAAGTGNLSSLDFVADRSTALASEIAWAKHGGAVANAEAKARAAYAKQQGRQQFANYAVGAATNLLSGGHALLKDQFPSIFPII